MKRIGTLGLVVALACAAAAPPQTLGPSQATPAPTVSSAPPPPMPVASAPLSAELVNALGALDPRSPWGYFELGEAVGADAQDGPSRALCRTLYVLAYETSKKQTDEMRRASESVVVLPSPQRPPPKLRIALVVSGGV